LRKHLLELPLSLLMSSNQNHASAADIISAALIRENAHPKALGTFGYLSLIKGRPHLYYGLRALLSHPALPFLALLQIGIVYVVVHDIGQSIAQYPDFLLLGEVFSTVSHYFPRWTFINIGILSSIPLFVILNMSWGVMAAIISKKYRGSMFMSGIGGLVSFRLMSFRYIPSWWIYRADIRASMSVAGRMLQFLMAYKFATGKSDEQIEIDFSSVLSNHFKEVMKSYCSYALYPAIWIGGSFLVLLLAKYLSGVFWPELLNQALNGWHFFSLFLPHFSLAAMICAWFAFERSCLGAMTFSFLDEAVNPQHIQASKTQWINAAPIVALGVITLFIQLPNMDEVSPVPYPLTTVIEPRVIYGIYNPNIPSPRAIATSGCHFELLQQDKPETIRDAFEGCSMGNLHLVGNNQYSLFTLKNHAGKTTLKAFVRPGESLNILVSTGYYTGSYDSGDVWYGTNYLFGLSTQHRDVTHFTISPTPFFGRHDLSETEEFLYRLGLPEDDMKKGYTIIM